MKSTALLVCLACAVGSTHAAQAASVGENYMRNCAVCHLPGIAGAPKVGDKAEWARRVRPGMSMLYRNAIEGMPNTAMMARGGHDPLSDEELKAVVDFMVAAASLDRQVLEAAGRYEKYGITDRDFIRLDRNFDGAVTRDELGHDPVLLNNLDRFDENRDGKLSEAEYRRAEVALERERVAVTVSDDALVKAVRAALAKVPGVDLPNTKVEVEKGTVAMIGIVEDAEVARQAHGLVKRINGIKKIDNRLVSGHQMGWD